MNATFRQDVAIGHDSRALVLTSKSQAESCLDIEPGTAPWVEKVQHGDFLPVALSGDRGGTTVRVLLDLPLSVTEEEEWINCITGKLLVPDGHLAICGSTDFLCPEGEDIEPELVKMLEVPAGCYRVDVYACFVGINGPGFGAVNDLGEPLGTWFRSTRPGLPFPLWLRLRCYEDPSLDPGHENEWESTSAQRADIDEDCNISWIDFIVRLTRTNASIPTSPIDENGFVPPLQNIRRLVKAPLGLST